MNDRAYYCGSTVRYVCRHQLEDPPGRRGGDPGTGRLFPCLLGRHPRRRGVRCLLCNAPAREPGCTFSTWAKASRYVVGALARGATPAPLFSSVQQSTAEPRIQDGTHWRQRFKRTRVFAIGPRGWEGGPQATRTWRSRGVWYGWHQTTAWVLGH